MSEEISPYEYQAIYHAELKNPDLGKIRSFIQELASLLQLNKPMDAEVQRHPDYIQLIENELVVYYKTDRVALSVRWWDELSICAISIHTKFDALEKSIIENCLKKYFKVKNLRQWSFDFSVNKPDNRKIIVSSAGAMGKGLFATQDIAKGEFVAGVYGRVYQAQACSTMPNEISDHTLQFAEHLWRIYHPSSNVVYFNHSCETNCGMSGYFDIVAVRDIKAGEQLFIDYSLFDDSDWEVEGGNCLCGSSVCRGKIMPYHQLPQDIKMKYRFFLSQWIIDKYYCEKA